MRILVYTDVHIGIKAGKLVTANHLISGHQDILIPSMTAIALDVYRQCVNLAIEHDVDMVLDLGDTHDVPNLSNLLLSAWLAQAGRLEQHGIHHVVLTGNHNYPKIRQWGSPLAFLEPLPHAYPLYRGEHRSFSFDDGVILHAVPWANNAEELRATVRSIRRDPKAKLEILLLHCGIDTLDIYQQAAQAGDQVLGLDDLPDVDYVFIGHYHHRKNLTDRVLYIGSAMRTGFDDYGHEPQALLLDTEANGPDFLRWIPLELPEMVDLPVIDARGLNGQEINEAIEATLHAAELENKIVRLRVLNVHPAVRGTIDMNPIFQAQQHALHFVFDVKQELPMRMPGRHASEHDVAEASGQQLEHIIATSLKQVARSDAEYEHLCALDRCYRLGQPLEEDTDLVA